MTALRWVRLTAAALAYIVLLAPAAALGKRIGVWAQRLDVQLDDWRHELQRQGEPVDLQVEKVAYAVRYGATEGSCHYDYLDDVDMERLARAIDNCGCYVKVWPRRLEWRRRDRHPKGELFGLHALAPADRDAWSDAIANLDGEAER